MTIAVCSNIRQSLLPQNLQTSSHGNTTEPDLSCFETRSILLHKGTPSQYQGSISTVAIQEIGVCSEINKSLNTTRSVLFWISLDTVTKEVHQIPRHYQCQDTPNPKAVSAPLQFKRSVYVRKLINLRTQPDLSCFVTGYCITQGHKVDVFLVMAMETNTPRNNAVPKNLGFRGWMTILRSL